MNIAEHILTWLGLTGFGLLLWKFLSKKPEAKPLDFAERRKKEALKAAQRALGAPSGQELILFRRPRQK